MFRICLNRTLVTNTSLPRISLPVKTQRKLQKIKVQQEINRDKKNDNILTKGQPVITCKRKQFNHYYGTRYRPLDIKCLASSGWKHKKSAGDHFTLNPFSQNPAFNVTQSFSDLKIRHDLIENLHQFNIKKPTAVQEKAIPLFLSGKNILCSAETGSGKTLAYLLPIIQNLIENIKLRNIHEIPNQPRAVVLVPNRELAQQVYNVAKLMCTNTDVTPHYFVGGRSTKKFLNNPEFIKMDLLVSTPGSLSKLLTNKIYNADFVKYVIVDECDTMMDDSFTSVTARVLRKLNVETSLHEGLELGTQIGLFSATIPKDVISTLHGLVDLETLERVQTPAVHKLMPHISQKFERVKSSERNGLLIRRLNHNISKNTPTIVFCNKSSTSSYLSYFLNENCILHEMVNGKMPQCVREGRYDKFQSGEVEVLIGTDILSRGLDTCRAQHIINYNFPCFMSDYIHRAGRVGRIQSRGTGFILNFIINPWEVELVWKIEWAARKVGTLDGVDANINKQLHHGTYKKSISNF